MQYNVAQLLKESTGATRTYRVDTEVRSADGAMVRVMGAVRLLRTERGIWASVTLEFQKGSVCCRCLSPLWMPVRLVIEEEYLPTIDVNTGEPLRVDEENEDSFTIDQQHVLDLTEAMRQYELASMPMKPLCKADCAGLCPVCGANLNQGSCACLRETRDPRWSALAKLLASGSE